MRIRCHILSDTDSELDYNAYFSSSIRVHSPISMVYRTNFNNISLNKRFSVSQLVKNIYPSIIVFPLFLVFSQFFAYFLRFVMLIYDSLHLVIKYGCLGLEMHNAFAPSIALKITFRNICPCRKIVVSLLRDSTPTWDCPIFGVGRWDISAFISTLFQCFTALW